MSGTVSKKQVVLFVLVFFAGFSALVLELVWVRILSVVFGRTILVTSAVVSAYMAGLGLGSLYWGRLVDRRSNSLRMFALLQLGAGISSLAVMAVFTVLPEAYRALHSSLGGSGGTTSALIYAVSFLIVLLPSVFMGGTLPVAVKVFVNSFQTIGARVGRLYALNTLGGIIGAGLSGYLLIGHLGQLQSQLLAAIVFLGVGAAALLISGHRKETVTETVKPRGGNTQKRDLGYALFLIVAGCGGYCGLAYEILAARALSIFLVNSTYSFSSILVVYLIGISLGSYLFSRYLGGMKRQFTLLAVIEGLAGLYLLFVAATINEIPVLLFPLNKVFLDAPLLRMLLPGLVLSSLILLVPSVLMGIAFPLLCRLYTTHLGQLGTSVGRVYFYSTLGSILGSVSAGAVLLPALGVVKGTVVISSLFALMGIAIALIDREFGSRKHKILVGASASVVWILFTWHIVNHPIIHPPTVFRTEGYSDKIVHYEETTDCTVLVREDQNTGQKTLYVNNNQVMGVTYDAVKAVKLLGHLPFFAHPTAKEIFVVGFGIGITAAEIAKHNIDAIDCAEICPGVQRAAQYFSKQNRNIADNPKLNFIKGDGRTHLLVSEKKYDIISSDPTHPTLGCANLYSREYFELCKNRLRPGGVVAQYVPLHRMSKHALLSSIKTFQTVFPHATLWLGHSHLILLGTSNRTQIDFGNVKRIIPTLNDPMLDDPYQIASSVLLSEDAVARLVSTATLHEDNRPFLEFYRPQSIKRENWQENLKTLLLYKTVPSEVIVNVEDDEKLLRYLSGRDYFLQALVGKATGDLKAATANYYRALKVNPENTELKRFLEYESRMRDKRIPPMGKDKP